MLPVPGHQSQPLVDMITTSFESAVMNKSNTSGGVLVLVYGQDVTRGEASLKDLRLETCRGLNDV